MWKQLVGAVWRSLPSSIRSPLSRLGQKRFTVTTAAAIFNDEGKVLLLEHVFRPGSGWGLPGGFLSSDEQPEEGLRRELREEIGIELDEVEILFARSFSRLGQLEIIFRARPIGVPHPCSVEIKRAEWFTLDRLPDDLSKDQQRLIERVVRLSENS
jgi:8-oxo-dGTP diphosphatase